MIFAEKSQLMLKYQKAKAKLVEFDVAKEDYPHFPLNSNDLSFSSTYILSRYAESVIENDYNMTFAVTRSITYGNCEGERMTYRYLIGNDLDCFRKYCEADDILARVRELIRENESQFEV